MPVEFWRDLQTAFDLYRVQQERRTKRPPANERARWQRIEQLTDALGAELRAVRMGLSWEHEDPLWPNRALRALWSIKHQAEANRIGNEMLAAGFNRRSDPHRALLFAAICDLWVIHLRQELHFSMVDGPPRGRTNRFFVACLEPVLGAGAVTTHAVRAAVKLAQRRLVRFELKK